MIQKTINLVAFFFCLHTSNTIAQIGDFNLDVLSYHVQLEPNIPRQYLKGHVIVNFLTNNAVNKVVFNCGNLIIDNVTGQSIESFRQKDQKLIVTFSNSVKTKQEIQIFYHGTPAKGVVFSSKPSQVYTVYFTSEWMVCNDQPHDRASIKMDLIIPDDLINIASGTLAGKKEIKDEKVMYSWNQEEATPAYTYGFAIGSFNKASDKYRGIALNYYSKKHDTNQLTTIFKSSTDILRFFEEKSGMPYFQTSYSQILIGNHYQEMSGFAVLNQSYGEMVLKDSTEINLIAHELAHQWWGNMITCKNWGHFWLNEAFATYMSAAYNEHRFGRDKYMQNINAYYDVYRKIKAKGADKALVFESWSNPTADDRNLVYFKGAYVLHILREKIGDENFWKGIKYYSQEHYGKSVVTQDFQKAMERSTKKSLTAFFDKWIY